MISCYYEKFGDGTEKPVEIPSAIPELWTWSHFGDVADVINGKNQSQVEDDTGEYPNLWKKNSGMSTLLLALHHHQLFCLDIYFISVNHLTLHHWTAVQHCRV